MSNPAQTGGFVLQPANDADCDWIVAQHAGIYSEEFGLSPAFGARIARSMAALRARESGFVRMIVAMSDGERAGFICVSDLDDGAFLNFVWVEPRFRKRGLAEALMNHALDFARSQNCRFVRLKTFSVLQGARRLYRRFGFAIDDVEKNVGEFGPIFDVEFWRLDF